MRFKQGIILTITMALLLLTAGSVWAVFGEDIEKPNPTFTRENIDYIAELIPRGKSTNIQIRFHAENGMLFEPVPMTFTDETAPKVDLKNYRSGFFVVKLRPYAPGEEVILSLSSTYFNSATDIWGVTDRASHTWGTTQITRSGEKGKPTVISMTVRDGSALDEDGRADGQIEIIIGPRDHFWGYAIGTLVIRFFGVFLVLGILMIGMLVSGKIFKTMDEKKQKARSSSASAPPVVAEEPEIETPEPVQSRELPKNTAAAIGMAMHLYTNGGRHLPVSDSAIKAAVIGLALHLQITSGTGSGQADAPAAEESNWAKSGRNQLMAQRQTAFNRF